MLHSVACPEVKDNRKKCHAETIKDHCLHARCSFIWLKIVKSGGAKKRWRKKRRNKMLFTWSN